MGEIAFFRNAPTPSNGLSYFFGFLTLFTIDLSSDIFSFVHNNGLMALNVETETSSWLHTEVSDSNPIVKLA